MSTSTGFANATIVNARVLGALKYIPAHLDKGKLIQARCDIPVRVNSAYGTDSKGEPGRKDDFTITAWNKLADTCARSCSPGKALSVACHMQSYSGRVFNRDGSLRLDASGQIIMVTKYSFVIDDISFGDDSAETIRKQVESGYRPINWNNPLHPEYKAWRDFLRSRSGIMWDGQSPTFQYAVVRIPQGEHIQLLTPGQVVEMRAGQTNRRIAHQQTMHHGQQAVNPAASVYNPGNLQTRVAETLNTAPNPATQVWTPGTVAQPAQPAQTQLWAPQQAAGGAVNIMNTEVIDY